MPTTEEKIQQQLDEHPIIIYMKGTPKFPQCGFSGHAVKFLSATGIDYAYVNVLEAPAIYERLPGFSQFPTFPQVFIGGELVGGSDIVEELANNGELAPMMEAAIAKSAAASGAAC